MHHRRRTARIEHFELAAERGVIGATAVSDIISAGPETNLDGSGTAFEPPGPMTLAQASTFQSGLIGLPSRVGGQLGRDGLAGAQHLLNTFATPLQDVTRSNASRQCSTLRSMAVRRGAARLIRLIPRCVPRRQAASLAAYRRRKQPLHFDVDMPGPLRSRSTT